MEFDKKQLSWLNKRTIRILMQLANNEKKTLKQVGLYQMPNKGKQIIIDQFPSHTTNAIVKSAYNIAKQELLKTLQPV